MNTDEHSVQTDAKTYGSQAPSQLETEPELAPEPEIKPEPKPLGPDDFHPAVVALSRLAASNRKYVERSKVKATGDELASITADLISSLASEEDVETSLRTQSELINRAFITLLMKTTRDEGFDEEAFASALRAQRQYRITCETLRSIKKAKEQTEKTARKSAIDAMRRNPNVDPYAHQYMDR